MLLRSLSRAAFLRNKQVCVQLPVSADNVTLLAFAAERRAAAPLLLSAGRAAIGRSLLAAGPTAANLADRRPSDGTDGPTDARQFHRPCGSACRASIVSVSDGDLAR